MYEDDDYYDDDDEEYEEEDSSRGLLIALVIVLILGVLAIFVAISIVVTAQTGGFGKLLAQGEATLLCLCGQAELAFMAGGCIYGVPPGRCHRGGAEGLRGPSPGAPAGA